MPLTKPSDDDLVRLPGILGEIAELCSVRAALKFARAFGGRKFYFCRPEHLHGDHPLVVAVGIDDAVTIAQHYMADIVDVPKAERWHIAARNRMMLQERQLGASQADLARKTGLTVRQVRNVLGVLGSDALDRNMDLFAD